MHLTSCYTLLACIPFLVAATPLASPSRRGTVIPLSKRLQISENGVVNVDVLNAHISKVTGKLSQGFRNFKRNTGSFHPNDKHVIPRKRSAGGDNLTDDSNSLWHGTILVGTPPVNFTVDFDTGSSDLFLPDVKCTANCQRHKAYDSSKSSTFIARNKRFSLSFGDGSTVQGNQVSDVVSIAGLPAVRQRIGSALQYSEGFSITNFPPDGLMGLGFAQISGFPATPLFQTLVKHNETDAPMFAFKLATNDSELFIGGVDPDKFVGDITEVAVTQVGFWQVDITSIDVAGKAVAKAVNTIIDTGTTLVMGDTKTVAAVYSAIPGAQDASFSVGQGLFTFPCDSTTKVSINFLGKEFVISPDTFNLGQVSANSKDCVGGIAASDALPFWILGDVFLQNVYTVFNTGNKTVGFADLASGVS